MGQYDIPKHRYRELKHFCLQYPEFKRRHSELCGPVHGKTDALAIAKTEYERAIELIEMTAYEASSDRGAELLEAVTLDTGYDELHGLREKFFWMLSKAKGL